VIELGGNITLVGFREIDKSELVVAKKIVGSYARKFSDTVSDFEHLTITLKPVHKHEGGGEKFELDAKAAIAGKLLVSEVVERNLFVGLDAVVSKVYLMAEKNLEKQKDRDQNKIFKEKL
jgi:ribosome-associated translation inhibitor RaiA